MIAYLVNALMASVFAAIAFPEILTGKDWRFGPFLVGLIAVWWLLSAVALLLRRRIGWIGSVAGLGTCVYLCLDILLSGFAPGANDTTDGAILFGMMVSGAFGLIVTLPMFIAFLLMRRRLFPIDPKVSNTDAR